MIPLPSGCYQVKKPILTWSLIVVNFLVFSYFYFQGYQALNDAIRELGMIPSFILSGEKLHTIITAMFMHGSWAHIVGNMLYLYVFGCPLEGRLGRVKFLALYLIGGVLAAFMHIGILVAFAEPMIVYGPYGGPELLDPLLIPTVGASGAISGLLGMYLNFFPKSRLQVLSIFFLLPIVFSVSASLFIVMWFLYQLLMGLMAIASNYFAGVAFWAHVGGFLAGWLITLPALRLAKRRIKVTYHRGKVWYEIPVE
ncbi:MAG: rhomboid family intramembrane serine protease [Candidatus Nezhaarchaeota archaeon]|nr:rhomboid family intramembrane serine protease [Candidatus Nezhaarchaeota archaeon]MCX8141161.1 rhomboid family intramembrane serine protease [Candidatus Nezhaarchaeota archaeon]MDW8050836.1 rhomboid family intramembrane serine protease [Nitrososphaerota archaeon]